MFLIIGTVTADLLVQTPTPLAALGGDGFRSSNLLFTDAPLTISMGGNGGNAAYVLAGLGAATALAGAVGHDLLGDALVGWLAGRGVNLDGLARSPTHATSTSTILLTGAENQVVYHHLGASSQAEYATIPRPLLDATQVLLASSFSILARLLAGGFAQALARVKNQGGITGLDIGPAIGPPVTLDEVRPLLADVDYLLANSHELLALTGRDSWPDAAEDVLAAGAKALVIKQGRDGSSLWCGEDRLHVPAFRVQTNVSVGAGDAFNVGFLYAIRQGWAAEEALGFGNGVAALVVANPKGILAAPSLADVKAFVAAHG